MENYINTKFYTAPEFNARFSVSDGGDDNLIMHCHAEYEILYFIRGDVTYLIEGAEYKLSAGGLLLLPPGVIHGVKACGNGSYQRYVTHMRKDMFPDGGARLLEQAFRGERYYEDTEGYGIGEAFDAVFDAAEFGRYAAQTAVEALVLKVLNMQRSLKASEPTAEVNAAVTQALTYLNENFTQAITLDDISSKFFVSKHHLNKLFRKATGVTVMDYVIYKRVFYAKELILRGVRASEAAERAGFLDYSAFYKAYVKRMGHSPQADKQAL